LRKTTWQNDISKKEASDYLLPSADEDVES
jgi:hypothetical protein